MLGVGPVVAACTRCVALAFPPAPGAEGVHTMKQKDVARRLPAVRAIPIIPMRDTACRGAEPHNNKLNGTDRRAAAGGSMPARQERTAKSTRGNDSLARPKPRRHNAENVALSPARGFGSG